ncbi:MAG: SusC/RagA family TonB-linked outer membrane protein [Bacteroidetes bacterium]|nr:SusC/RagA family TonB-linked outer membrane protein [Bacteroidota bacterium]
MKRRLVLLMTCLLFSVGLVVAQNKRISGTVVDSNGDPVTGATVVVKGTTVGVSTDIDGKYSISVPQNGKTLVISLIGSKTKEMAVGDNLKIVLENDSRALDEVVVTALGITREKKALGYSVSEVSSDELTKSRGGLSNPINALQGKVAGLQIASGSGSMGGSSKILLRGSNSISGNNQPLFVVDGVPIEGTSYNSTDTQRGSGGYDYGNLIQDINPDDIENISILKGPNAAALYGSRAANGVIMITTKKGVKNGGYGVTFNSGINLEVVNKLPKLQKLYGGGYGSDFEQVTINGTTYNYPDLATDESWGPKYEGQTVLGWYDLAKWEANEKSGNPTTSIWQTPKNDFDTFFETGVSYTNNISLSNATDRSSVRFSYTNSDLKGYMPNSSLRKNIFSVSASSSSLDKKLEVFSTVNYFNSAAKGRSETGYADNNVMQKFVQWGHRELDMKELKALYIMPDGTQASWNRSSWDDPTPAYSNNPYWSRYKNYENDSRNRIYGNAGVSYKVIPDLKAQYKVNFDFFVDKQYTRNAVGSQETSEYTEMSRQQYELNNEFMLMYNKQFGDYSLSANLGSNLMYRRYEYIYGTTNGGLVIPDLYNLSNSLTAATSENYLRKKATNSLFGNVNLGYKNYLYLDATLRNDWSSTLPESNRSYLYPSLTGSFVFSELTKASLPLLSLGKFRAGYAQVGNDTDPYQLVDTYSKYTSIDSDNGALGYVLSTTKKNSNLKSELTRSYEFGLELSFFKNRLGIDATYYYKETKNQIIPLSLSGSTGYTSQVINAGLINNKGVEFSLHATPIDSRGFTWTTILTLASNKNKVKELVSGVDYYKIVAAPFKVEIGAMKGQAYGVIMGTNYLYDDNGNKIIDSDGNYEYTSDNENLGSIYPDFTGGFSNSFRYKNLDLSVLLDFSKGGHYFSTSYMWGMYSGMLEETAANNVREDGIILDGVQEDGTKNTVVLDGQAWGEAHYSGPAAQSVFRSDYVKLREINMGYNVPLKSGAFVRSLRVSAYGRNLAVWGPDTKHFDPEMVVTGSGNIQGIEGGALPSVASFGLNVSLKF